jgi:putative ABC transport system permease protein
MGWKGVWREKVLLFYCGAALAAVLGPLLLIYGFKFGIITALLNELEANAATRQIVLQGDYTLPPARIEELRQLPKVAFLEPMTRTLAARMEVQKADKAETGLTATLLPTGPGDPLLPSGMVIEIDEGALSFSLAEKLHVQVGDSIRAMRRRVMSGNEEEFAATLLVRYIVPRGLAQGDTLYAPSSFLETAEQFSDGYEVRRFRLPGRPVTERETTFANVRLYAATISDVKVVAAAIEAMGYRVSSRADEVEQVMALNRSLAAVFALVASVGAVGYTVSLATSLAGAIEQKRRLLSMLRLMGATPRGLLLFPLAQGIAIAGVGYVMASAVYLVVAHVANGQFAGSLPGGGEICRLAPQHFLTAAASTFVIVLVVIALVARSLTTLPPAQVLHEE